VSDKQEANMSTYALLAITAVGYVAAAVLGYLQGRERDRKIDRAWSSGYAAGLAKADQMWPAVNRWEMR
jgi:hypothetical protein